jgi:hypothetical protein
MLNTEKVEIGCIQCREKGFETYFSQVVADHLAGHGCRRCNLGGFNFDLPAVLYILSIKDSTGMMLYWKLGITNVSAEERASDVRQSMRRSEIYWEVEVIDFINFDTGKEAFDIEQAILSFRDEILFKEEYTPEVRFEGYTECFPVEIQPFDIGKELFLF